MGLFGNLFDSEKRHFHQAEVLADKVLKLEETYAQKSDDELREVTKQLQEKIQAGASLKDVLPDAFANAREAAKRVLNEFPYRVQVLGGILLHEGDIAEMKTGEGKTLTAVMPIYLHALAGKGAHVVTVNEYLAKRDAEWMGRVYTFLGLTVGCNLHSLSESEKRDAYACDITYTTNSELGFDYLRDNMVMRKEQRVLRGLHYAVLDEVDSILIDEARTPLIISGPGPVLDQQYIQADRFAKSCKRDVDFEIDREDRTVVLTDAGLKKADRAFGIENIYNGEHASIVHYIQNAMRANYLMTRDVEYVVGDDEIILVDQFTGRKMAGREFSDGLHQAIQAKENVGIKQETITLATITYQNFFRLYDLLSGMTGTAKTEEDEFLNTYNMRVYEVPTNRPIARIDEPDLVFKDRHEKYEAIVKHTKELHEKGQPVLIGTLSIGINEALSEMLKKQNIPHHVLNAKNDENEAEIITKAGQKFAVTVATNMAGRGTDIKLGEGVAQLGGLAVLGSERHEAKRIDNQLRGRSGRQGDPGMSRFYVSVQDDLMVRFGAEHMEALFAKLGDTVIESKTVTRSISGAQRRVEGVNYDARKQLLQYDDVMRQQRETMYETRNYILENDDVHAVIYDM
ncbi:MAG: preprotein translocase subunit SecA, partial [Solobacterium sp.]|nr:preprotein translocase subunit SecA [Solobacterium sp.]